MYLFLAFFWGVLGITWLVWQRLDPNAGDLMVRWTNVSAGWFALALALYNLVRWWSRRTQTRQGESWDANMSRRRFSAVKPRETPDPNFEFQSPPEDEKPSKP